MLHVGLFCRITHSGSFTCDQRVYGVNLSDGSCVTDLFPVVI